MHLLLLELEVKFTISLQFQYMLHTNNAIKIESESLYFCDASVSKFRTNKDVFEKKHVYKETTKILK